MILKKKKKLRLTAAQAQRKREIELMDKKAREAGKVCPWQIGGWAR